MATRLEALKNRAGLSRVILVEGKDDIDVFSYFFDLLEPNWRNGVSILDAGGKKHVQNGVKKYDDWVGIVDKDEWSSEQVQQLTDGVSSLNILPRFCLENYFCVPSELWNALPMAMKQDKDYKKLEKKILKHLEDWVAHGAMWRVIQKRRSILCQNSAFPSALDASPITDDDKIKEILHSWHEKLEPKEIFQEYQNERKKGQAFSENKQLKTYVHGKKFFNTVVVDVLNDLFGQKKADKWQQLLANTNGLALPVDLESFLQGILDDVRSLSQ